MHFWIDKRSQQCGFGRSRVAASLSGTGTGVGLGFGHPPRRTANKAKTGQAMPTIHRQQQQNYIQHNQPPHSTSSSTMITGDGCNSRSQHHISHNNNCSYQHSQISQPINSNMSMPYNSNNNTDNNQLQSCTNLEIVRSSTNAINNNNAAGTATASTVLKNSISGRTMRHNYKSNTHGQSATQAHTIINANHYDMRSYHHPQFGNMSVRHFQNVDGFANASHQLRHTTTSTVSSTGNIVGTVMCRSSGNETTSRIAESELQLVDQQQYRPHYSIMQSGYGHSQNLEDLPIGRFGDVSQDQTLHSNNCTSVVVPVYRNSHTVNIRTHAMSQLLPSYVKCGFCALVLISVFVAGAKFYFDHQGTVLEILIFCAFSVTFFFLACTISLCRIPNDLISLRSEGTLAAVSDNNHVRTLYNQYSDQRMHESQEPEIRTTQVQGPPPYHVAILLSPEKGMKLQLDESPPPSYDKILI